MCLFLFVLVCFSGCLFIYVFHMWVKSYGIYLSPFGLFHLAWYLKVHPCCHKWNDIISYNLVVFQPTYTLHLLYTFIHLSELSFHITAVINNSAVKLVDYISFGHSDSKESACNAGDPGLIPGSGRFPGEGNGKPLQYSCLENSKDRGALWGIVYGVSESQTQLSD